MRLSVSLLIFILQLPFSAVSLLGAMYLKDGIEINKIWQQEIDLLEELEEKEEEIKIGFEWIESFHLSRIGNGFEVALGFTELFFPLGGNLLAEIPPEA